MTPRSTVRVAGPAFTRPLILWIRDISIRLRYHIAHGRFESAVGVTVGAVWLAIAPLFFLCAIVDYFDRGPDAMALFLSGVAIAVTGLLTLYFSQFPSSLPLKSLFAALVCGALSALVAVTVAHFVTGVTPTFDSSLAEGAATITGTNSSTINPEQLSLGMLLFRALGQWLGSAALIVVLVRIAPHLGVGGLDADGGVSTRSARRLAPKSGSTMARLLLLYVSLTVLLLIAYFSAGMPFVDSVLHCLTTVSSGGFSSRSGSVGAFNSGAIEWVAISGMLIAGTSLPLIFRALRRGDLRRFTRSIEFRTYIGLVVTAVVAALAWSGNWPKADEVRETIFAVASAVSTTGFVAHDLNSISYGAEAVLLVLMVIGGMSASVAGGFTVMRFMVVSSYIGRELRRSIHPAAVEKIHLGKSSIGEVALARIIGELFLSAVVILPLALVLSADGLNFEAAFSFAISALSNVGFAFGLSGPEEHLRTLGALGHLAAALLMLIGRISVTPLLVTLGGVGEPMQREIRRWRLTRHEKAVR